jgi:hypothetical protein
VVKLFEISHLTWFAIIFIAANLVVQANIWALSTCFAVTHGGPYVIITVDVETTKYQNRSSALPLPEQVNAICETNIPCGMQKMVSMLREKGYAATFFYNVYEYQKYGEETVKNIAIWLDQSGQDVQLHTHPQWAYDSNRNYMYQYSLDEQIEIVRRGKELLEMWTGKPVIAHRAGAYAADENTLMALIRNNILYDGSLFIASPNSKISTLDLSKNTLSLYGPLYEFPVTVYKKKEYPPYFVNKISPIERIRKYDVNSFVDETEGRKAMQEILNMKLDFIILFLHSFSFIKEYDVPGKMEVDKNALKIFNYVLDFINRKQLGVLTFRDIKNNKIELEQFLNTTDTIPDVSINISAVQYMRKRIGINRNNYKIYLSAFGFFTLLIIVLCIGFARKRKSNG